MSEFIQLLHDPAHWGFEIVSDAVVGLFLIKPFNMILARHDRKKHSNVS